MIQRLVPKRDLFSGLILVVLGIYIFLYSRTFPSLPEGYPGPGLFPKWIAAGIFLSGGWLTIAGLINRSKVKSASSLPFSDSGTIRLLAGILLVLVFPFLSARIGFLAALGVMCFGFSLLFKVKIWLALLVGLGTSGLIYLIFSKLLSVPL